MMQVLPLTGSHDRKRFDCGKPVLNEWLQRVASQHLSKGLSRTYVAVLDSDPNRICGYFALTLAEMAKHLLPPDVQKKLPNRIPGIRLGRLAVDKAFQGRALGELLLLDAMHRALRVHQEAGGIGLFVDALDDSAAAFYRSYGFVALADEPLRLFLPLTILMLQTNEN